MNMFLCLSVLLQMGQTALHVAALWGNTDAIRVLIQLGANPNAENMRCVVSIQDCTHVISMLFNHIQ